MPDPANWKIQPADLKILHRLAIRKLEISQDQANLERKRLWYALDEGRGERPMILTESGVAFDMLPDAKLECEEQWARNLERGLRHEIFQFEKIQDDHVIEPWISCNWSVHVSGFGVEAKVEWADRVSGNVSSRRWEPPIKNLATDLGKLQHRTFSVNREATFAWKEHLEKVFTQILPVRIRGGFWWTLGMTWTAIDLIGLEPLMLYMCTEPEGLHRLMGFLRDDNLALIDWLEEENLFTLNNENDYIGSGSMGYSHRLPGNGWKTGDPVRAKDIWTLCESQETVSVGPAMFEEFVFPYQTALMERFGACYYGCCEPLHTRWEVVKRIPNLRRVSVSPWCDQKFMADALKRDYVFSCKPLPSLISTDVFDEDAIRDDLRKTMETAANCNLEIIMKDVHTLANQPQRMARWVELAREAAQETAGLR